MNNTTLKITQKDKGFVYEGQLYKIDGQVCKTKRTLFAIFANSLNFPDYFGYNWDSFEECLDDALSADNNVGMLVINGEDICSENFEDKITFYSICSSISNRINLKRIYIEFNTELGYSNAKQVQMGLSKN